MKQKIFSFLLVVVMIVVCFPMRASAVTIASGYAGPNANWSLDNGGHLKIYGSGLIGGPFSSPMVVTNAAPWGDYADQITSITIGQGITAIDDGSFINLHKLCEVSIPASVTSIGEYAFYNCENLVEVHLQEGLQSIERYAFANTGLPYIQLPNTLKTIGESAFAGSDLLELNIPLSVTEMGPNVAANCQLMLTASVPSSVITLSRNIVFGYTPNLVYARVIGDKPAVVDFYFTSQFALFCIFYDEGTKGWDDIADESCMILPWKEPEPEDDPPINDKLTWRYDNGTLYVSGSGPIDDVQLIMEYKNNAPWEKHNSEIKAIVIRDGITHIGKGAFAGLPNLKTVSVPQSVTVINDFAFYNCFSLENVDLSNGVTSIGAFAFQSTRLPSITLPDSLTTLGIYAFTNSGLTGITLPEGVCSIPMGSFFDCPNLASFTALGPIQNIGDYAFRFCPQLGEIVFSQGATGYIGMGAFSGCHGFSTFEIPEGITHIGESAFGFCDNLQTIEIPNTVRQIDKSAFEWTQIETITIPESVVTLGDWILDNCDSLTGVTMYSKTLENWDNNFGITNNLAYVHVIGDKPNTNHPFANTFVKEFTVYYDEGTSGWEGNTWNHYILAIWGKSDDTRQGTCGESVSWHLENGILTISGTGAMYNYEWDSDTPWYLFRDRVITVNVEDGITHIGDHAFQNFKMMESITLPSSLLTIGYEAMESCIKLQTVNIPENVTEIMGYAFYRNSELKTVSIGDSVTSMGDNVFAECVSLTSVTLSKSLTSIPNNAFFRCHSLTDVTIPQGVVTIGMNAFCECENLQTLVIPDTVTEIKLYAFQKSGILELTFPKSITTFGRTLYDDCPDLRAVHYQGEPPFRFEYSGDADITIYYPASSEAWDAFVTDRSYYDNITWISCETMHDIQALRVEPNCTEAGFIATGCACGYHLEEEVLQPLGHRYIDGICQVCGEEAHSVLTGDADLDGEVTYLDAMLILQCAVNLAELPLEVQSACDVDNDGAISYLDAMIILQIAVGLI